MHHRHPCISSPAFSPFFNTSFLFRSNRCTPRPPRSKVVSTIFPLTDSSLSLSLSSYLILSTFYPFVYFARKNRQVGGRGKRHFAGRKPRYIENSSRTKRIPRPWRRMSERSFRNRFVRGYREGDATENKEEDGKVIRWPFVVPSVK